MGWTDLPNSQLDQYLIIEEIARGGMSRVYRAHDTQEDREVAVKVMAISSDTSEHGTFLKRFENEAHAIELLNHPNIVRVFGYGRTDEFVYIAMQLVTGGTFRGRLGRPMDVAEACAAMYQMARALHHAHMYKVVHRDVKPANMLIDAQQHNHLLLADFGISKIIDEAGITKTGTAVGTPEYMAPEQAKGEKVDHRADIYGLGCVLYEALAGRPPFIGPTALSICYQHVHTRPAYIRGYNPNVPRALALIIEKALSKNPDQRYQSADELANELYPFAEPNESVLRRTGPLAKRATPSTMPDVQMLMSGEETGPGLSLVAPLPTPSMPQPHSDTTNPVLDLSDVRSRPIMVPVPVPDPTTRPTEEIMPIQSAGARPRHTRPQASAVNRRTPSALRPSGSLPQLDIGRDDAEVSQIATIQQPVPIEKVVARRPSSPSSLIIAAIAIVVLVVTLVTVVLLHSTGGSATSQTASRQIIPTATIVATRPSTQAPTVTPPVATATDVPPTQSPVTDIAPLAIPLASAATTADPTCRSNSTSFAAGTQPVITACVANGYGNGKVSITVMRNGAFFGKGFVLVSGAGSYNPSTPATYTSGSYEVQIFWNDGLARTLTFTIG